MLGHVTVSAEGHKVRERIVTLLAPLGFVVDLEILQRAASLTPPPVTVQHPLHQAPVNLLPQLDPLYLPQPRVIRVLACSMI